MNCPLNSGQDGVVLAYVSRSLGTDESAEFERHLEDCAECRRIVVAQWEVWSALDLWTPPPVSDTFDARLSARIAAEERRSWSARFTASLRAFGFRPMVPVAAACAAVLGVFLLDTPRVPAPAVANPAQTQMVEADQTGEVNQVERGLDDMEMLNRLWAPSASGEAGSSL